jgi:esterase/lipase superfamily enzyme
MIRRVTMIMAGALGLSGCATTANYGKVPHAQYVADPRCAVEPKAALDGLVSSDALFVTTSRLPDCRSTTIALSSFRSEQMRFGRFDAPRSGVTANGEAKQVVPLDFQSEAQWWADLETAMVKGDGRVLVYVHGYRETFVSSSRDSFQIKRLVGFTGPVIQYSWPSQGALFGYLVDETNLYWDEQNFRRFLTKLAERPWTKEIVIVSHSMGARLVLPAVEFVDRASASVDSSNISNIILASPDVDRQDFERDIAEEILSARRVNNDRRITVYVSRKDRALALSRRLHGYPRLGSPFCFDPFEAKALKAQGLPQRCYATKSKYDITPQKSGLTIIDTTDVKGGGTGHSDYLTSAPVCLDFKAVVGGQVNRTEGRVATKLSHVFTLRQPPIKVDDAARLVCKRDK